MADATLQPIYERLHGIADYKPLTANTFSDWALEAGDIVKVVRGNEEYNIPIHTTSLVWKGTQQIAIESNGKKERDSIAKASAQKYGRGGAAVRSNENMYLHFKSEDEKLRSDLEMTESHLRIEFESEINSLHSELEITASHLQTEFEDGLNGLHSELETTASQFRVELDNDMSNVRAAIQVQANRIGLVVEGTGANAHIKPAAIVAAINDDGTSQTLISADKVLLDGDTTIHGMLDIAEGSLRVKGNAVITGAAGLTLTGESASVHSKYFSVPSSGSINFGGSTPGSSYSLTGSDVNGMIIKAAIDGNTLQLWKHGDNTGGNPSITFSKATSLSPSWSGNRFTVTAQQTNSGITTDVASIYTDITTGFITTTSSDPPAGNYITAYRQNSGDAQATEVRGARMQIQLGTLAATPTVVRVLNADGTAYINGSPIYTIPLQTKSVNASTTITTVTPGDGYVGLSSVSVDASGILADARIAGFTACYQNIEIDPDSAQTLNPGGSVTVKAKAYQSPSAQVKTDVATVTVSARALSLQSKQVTANGVVTADSGYDGLSSVDVQVSSTPVTPVLTGSWSNNVLTVTSTPAPSAPYETILSSVYENSSGTHYIKTKHVEPGGSATDLIAKEVALDEGTLSSGSRTITLKYGGSATSLTYVCSDYGSVTIGAPYCSNTTPAVADDATRSSFSLRAEGSNGQKSASSTLTLSNSTYSSGTLRCVNVTLSSVIIGRISTQNIYTLGYNAGQSAISLTGPDWTYTDSRSYNTATIKTSGRTTELSKGIGLYLTQGSWGADTYNTVNLREGSTSGTIRASINVYRPSVTGVTLGSVTSGTTYSCTINYSGGGSGTSSVNIGSAISSDYTANSNIMDTRSYGTVTSNGTITISPTGTYVAMKKATITVSVGTTWSCTMQCQAVSASAPATSNQLICGSVDVGSYLGSTGYLYFQVSSGNSTKQCYIKITK